MDILNPTGGNEREMIVLDRKLSPIAYGIDAVRAHLASRLRSGDFWIFIIPNALTVSNCLLEIEKRYYSGSANTDFEVALMLSQLGRPAVAIACARKNRMPARNLLRTLRAFIELPETARVAVAAGKHDVLILDDAGPNGRALMMAFLDFIQPGAALRAALRN